MPALIPNQESKMRFMCTFFHGSGVGNFRCTVSDWVTVGSNSHSIAVIIPFKIRTTYDFLLNEAISEQTSSTLMGLASTLSMPAAR